MTPVKGRFGQCVELKQGWRRQLREPVQDLKQQRQHTFILNVFGEGYTSGIFDIGEMTWSYYPAAKWSLVH
jgi:hypothetical protein